MIVRLPKMFFEDHEERELPTPARVKENARSVWVDTEDPAFAELVEDARYYVDNVDSFTPDSVRYCRAAARMLAAIEG